MFRAAFSRTVGSLKKAFVAHCDDGATESQPDLIAQANAKLESEKPKISTPPSFENFKNGLNQSVVQSFDGFRMVLQKQVNLNSVVNHFYWIGSQQTQQPIYQYRIILPLDSGVVVNCATDVAMNTVDGDVRIPINDNISSKVFFNMSDQNSLAGEVEVTDEASNTTVHYSRGKDSALTVSYMQAITPHLVLGGLGSYSLKGGSVDTAVGGSFTYGDNVVSGTYDGGLRLQYLKKVNPNRVHLITDLQVPPTGESQMTVGAEYILKQSKLSMSIDSNLHIRSYVETALGPGMQLQFAGEFNQPANVYRFGYGLFIG